MTAYYNEKDKYAAAWLRVLISNGHIAPGDVDDRDIRDVAPHDLRGYTQCHFFAGIGGWPLAFRLAGWPDHRRAWSGSCPCPPFSIVNAVHGRRIGQADERHLFPTWFKLIAAERPDVVFGEQVKGAIAFGWLDDVFDAMGGIGYTSGAAIAPACSVGSPQERERVWFVCDTDSERHQGLCEPETHLRAREAVAPWRSAVRTGRAYRGKTWLTEPGLCRLVDGISDKLASVRAFGNAIVPQLGAEFIRAYIEARQHLRLDLSSARAGIFA